MKPGLRSPSRLKIDLYKYTKEKGFRIKMSEIFDINNRPDNVWYMSDNDLEFRCGTISNLIQSSLAKDYNLNLGNIANPNQGANFVMGVKAPVAAPVELGRTNDTNGSFAVAPE